MSEHNMMHPTLAKTASIEYANLFRGLSTFEIDSFPSTIENKHDSKSDQDLSRISEQEKTYSTLTDMLLQHQDLLNSGNEPNKLARLNTVKEIKVETNHEDDIIGINREHMESSSENNVNDSIINVMAEKSKAKNFKNNREKIHMKRLSTTSTTSSAGSSNVVEKRRGRRPISSNTDNPRQATKKQLIIEQSNGNMVYFGNKLVEKKTAEYEKRRQNNNEAVKKCREKLAIEQKEKEEKMKLLNDENVRLTSTVESLSKELSLLKSIIAKMSPDQKLPEYLEQLIKNMEEET